jgi:hypothetical protein
MCGVSRDTKLKWAPRGAGIYKKVLTDEIQRSNRFRRRRDLSTSCSRSASRSLTETENSAIASSGQANSHNYGGSVRMSGFQWIVGNSKPNVQRELLLQAPLNSHGTADLCHGCVWIWSVVFVLAPDCHSLRESVWTCAEKRWTFSGWRARAKLVWNQYGFEVNKLSLVLPRTRVVSAQSRFLKPNHHAGEALGWVSRAATAYKGLWRRGH